MTIGRAFLVAGVVLGVIAALCLFHVFTGVSLATALGLVALAICCVCAAGLV